MCERPTGPEAGWRAGGMVSPPASPVPCPQSGDGCRSESSSLLGGAAHDCMRLLCKGGGRATVCVSVQPGPRRAGGLGSVKKRRNHTHAPPSFKLKFSNAIVASLQPLAMLVFVVLIACVVSASAIYYAERGIW